jgi:hypothetical protein
MKKPPPPVELAGDDLAFEIDSNPPRKSRDVLSPTTPSSTLVETPVLPPSTPGTLLSIHQRGSSSTGSQTPLMGGTVVVSPMESTWTGGGERHEQDHEQERARGDRPRVEGQQISRTRPPRQEYDNFI